MRNIAVILLVSLSTRCAKAAEQTVAEQVAGEARSLGRALAYLAREVPRWKAGNGCFSCHNNGDAARALYVAKQQNHPVVAGTLTETTQWLDDPNAWGRTIGDEPFKDKKLAAIQFGSALVEAIEARALAGRESLIAAANQVASLQEDDGRWAINTSGFRGSPVTYGDALATAMSRHILIKADKARFSGPIESCDRWLRTVRAHGVVDMAGTLIGLQGANDEAAHQQRQRCVQGIARAQEPSGGWGPYRDYVPEAFDTAVALIALEPWRGKADVDTMIVRGRRYLVQTQSEDGSWPETTRPAGAVSYAHRVSTTAWATLALLARQPADRHEAEHREKGSGENVP